MATFERMPMSDLEFEIEKKSVDSVFVAFADAHGRLVGRHVTAQAFMTEALSAGVRVPSFLLTTDCAGRLDPAYAFASPETGYPDLLISPDTTTVFRMPWAPGTVGVLGDLEHLDGARVPVAPRSILKRQLARLEDASLAGQLGIEVQVTLYETDPSGADARLDSVRSAPLLRRMRNAATEAPVVIEGSDHLRSPGLFEIPIRVGDILTVCDGAAVLREAVRTIAGQDGVRASFMAAPDDTDVSAGHVSMSVRGLRGGNALTERYGDGTLSQVGRAYMAGQLAHAGELFLLYAPTVNSYRRLGSGTLTPSNLTWGVDNRTCAFRVVGSDTTLRVENRLVGSDANPYLAASAMIAAGLDGMAHQLQAADAVTGNAHQFEAPALPGSLAEAVELWQQSAWVASVFGPEVQAHYATTALAEVSAAGQDPDLAWERARYFDAC